MFVVDGPEGLFIGLGEVEGIDLVTGEELEVAFRDLGGEGLDGFVAGEEEEEPMVLVFVAFFSDHGEEVEVLVGDVEACFFFGFTDGAFERRFAVFHMDFAADGGPEVFIGGLGAF